MDRLNFNTSVLGKKASERLRNLSGAFLTLRSKSVQDEVEVYLDDNKLGVATVKSKPYLIPLHLLTLSHARLGGFDTVGEQVRALAKAGYRFRPIETYEAYVICFTGDWGNKEG